MRFTRYLKVLGYAFSISMNIVMSWMFCTLVSGVTFVISPDSINALEFIAATYGIFFTLFLIVNFVRNERDKKRGRKPNRTY